MNNKINEIQSPKRKNMFESVLMRWMKLELIIQSEVSQKEKHQYSIQFSCSVVSDSLRPHGLQPARLPCPWDLPAIKNNTSESVLMRWMKLELIIQCEVSQKEKHQYSILTHIYGI